MNRNGEDFEDEYVDVTDDYSYHHKGCNIRIYRHERYMVYRKDEDWWQVRYIILIVNLSKVARKIAS